MQDVWIAVGSMLLLSFAAAAFVTWLGPSRRIIQFISLAVVCLFLATFASWGLGNLQFAKWIPHSAAIIWSNFMPVAAGIGAGIGMRLEENHKGQRRMLVAAFAFIAGITVFWPLLSIYLRPPPQGGNRWNGPIALQTSPITCSPAAAATFLSAGGISVSEAELVGPCFTDSSGTPSLGLYRGIKLHANAAGRDIRVITGTVDDVIRENKWPVFAMVKVPLGEAGSKYAEHWGLIPGLGHSVVILGNDKNLGFIIGDPAVGLERWNETDIRALWKGDGIQFVPTE